uniref:Putative secreted protein n=1 Tax=Panstrongylus lignarius TaxID=156445 RepID=A0A224Y3Q7_9HEMI
MPLASLTFLLTSSSLLGIGRGDGLPSQTDLSIGCGFMSCTCRSPRLRPSVNTTSKTVGETWRRILPGSNLGASLAE